MKNTMKYLAGLMLVVMMTGCFPQQKIIWSPDGNQAVALSDDGELYRCDPDGTLSEKLLDDVVRVAWRKDSHGLVLARMEKVSNWEDAQKLLCSDEARDLIAIGDTVYANWLQTRDLVLATDAACSNALLSDNQKDLVSYYLRDRYSDLAEDVVQPDPVEMLIIQLATLDDAGIKLGHGVAGASDLVFDLRISPADDAVAYSAGDIFESPGPVCLYVAALTGSGVFHRVASSTCLYPDWSKDGQYLVYAVSKIQVTADELVLGAIVRRQVADEKGLIEAMPDEEDMVGLIMNPLVRVRCLPDSSIVFSAFEVQLPAVAGDMPEYMNFFLFDPQRPATAVRLFPRTIEPYLGESSMLFEPSPDGRKIAFLDSQNRTAIVTLSTGELKHVPASDSEDFLPSWRGNEEVYAVCKTEVKEDGETRRYMVRYVVDADSDPVEISTSWPEDML